MMYRLLLIVQRILFKSRLLLEERANQCNLFESFGSFV